MGFSAKIAGFTIEAATVEFATESARVAMMALQATGGSDYSGALIALRRVLAMPTEKRRHHSLKHLYQYYPDALEDELTKILQGAIRMLGAIKRGE